ncbi:alpha-glucuronidase family glycosyl hydrolase [Xanthomonas citri pv. malvacearum]|uniref:Xylan alpha-1,2-glucuronidase n=1 Tax=Xanthomonas campestris pv. malvacearum TaxID=86040 RepID=A0AA45BTU2_XANCM|nr:alpha-glucuronidase family glycosyl hydrolase [Xanthomonas citri]OOW59504.1 alpha-glucuronidase [Xanthomonas campestris pv. thespesiae]OOW76311.1 alpha-glucuronidase [Xanthomonas campestris pv. leeana]AOL21290.1 alpha-glucuronidase [Xanthomonas citri pv. malvacearum]ASN03303.1 alpha-glucuronidase [Xanthomonas citri pv. malvacearum]ASN11530.1 alpha-glucuronidase [Xanthomonas citri pv. malvacearum]
MKRHGIGTGAITLPALMWLALLCSGLLVTASAHAEDGYDLWLRYQPLANAAQLRDSASQLVVVGDSPTLHAARDELARGLQGLLGSTPPRVDAVTQDGALVLGAASAPQIAALKLNAGQLGRDGYLIRSAEIDGHRVTAIVGGSDIGVLYGTFHLLRLLQTGQSLAALDVRTSPRLQLRMLNHWDNLDGLVERGYAGASLWNWQTLPGYLDPRYTDYARANASLGINGTVLNNVNANAWSLTPQYLDKAAALANVFRPYGIAVFLSARFSAPIEIGGLKTADPLDPQVQRWWCDTADAIYARIPDFGGFLVKANSEGQPGPQDYGRSHADGANLLADALAPHGGVVMWRAFVYSHEQPDDRAKQAYSEFVPLDGAFADNVIVQVKNGAIDFQPREPFHPLFGAMRKTPLMPEFQITKEYLGFSTHLAYLGPLFSETLQADTYARGKGSTVAKTVDGRLFPESKRTPLTGIAGVANIGADRNWSGSIFDQANWYAYGRLAWDPQLSPQAIAQEWARMTFSNDPAVVEPVVGMMLRSREAVVDYMTPLGLHHLMGRGHHYGPAPWDAGSERPDWDPVYYHRADRNGIGFDRSASGSNAVAQYAPPVARVFGDVQRVPEPLLLWFHHVRWDHRMASGRPLWDELVWRYDHGVAEVAAMRTTWQGLAGKIDAQRYQQVADFLAIQQREAQWWRDASIAYFQNVSGRPLPAGVSPPAHPLAYYQALTFPYAPGNPK